MEVSYSSEVLYQGPAMAKAQGFSSCRKAVLQGLKPAAYTR